MRWSLVVGRLAPLLIGVLVPLHAQAADSPDLSTKVKACTKIRSSVERLACFDELTPAPEVASSAPKDGLGKWRVSVGQSKIDDTPSAFAMIDATAPILSGYRRSTPTLFLRCSEGKTSAFITTEAFLGSDDTSVTYRIDKGKAVTRSLGISTDHKAFGWWNGAASVPLIKSLFGAELLTVRLTPYSESPVTIEFEVVGVEAATADIRKFCKW